MFTGLCVGCSHSCALAVHRPVLAVHRPVCWLFTGLCIWHSLARVLAVHRPEYWVFIGTCIGCSQAFELSVHMPLYCLLTGLCIGCSQAHTQPPVSLHGQLLWREFFYTVAAGTPNFDRMEGNPVCIQIPWDTNPQHLAAWSQVHCMMAMALRVMMNQ